MKTTIRKHILTATLALSAGTMMAQELNSAYFTEDYKYRHTMNAAFGNDQGYAAIPILGNTSMRIQGNLGVGDVLWKNPVAGKKTTTFMNPNISASDALGKFDKDGSKLLFDMDLDIVSVGFRGFGGYNTVELRERTSVGLMLPYEFFEFAKSPGNHDYHISNLGVLGQSYAELALGHSHQIMDNLRVGAKVKLLFGGARGELKVDDIHAKLTGDEWVLEGKATAELNLKGAQFESETKEYKDKSRAPYQQVNDVNVDGGGLGGFGLGLDLGAVYEFKDFEPAPWLEGLRVSAALNDLGFINWSNSIMAENNGKPVSFSGFNNMDVKKGDDKKTFDKEIDDLGDDLTDFIAIQDKGDQGSKTTSLAATAHVGLEYPLPVYDKLTFGALYTHRFNGDYSWSEGRVSANWTPLTWLDGGINVAFTSYCTTMGWILNIHPVGMNIFFGMDHMIGKTGASMVPLDSNVSFCFGMNVAWGGKKKKKTLNNI